jgi:hypothetical protein
MAKAKPPSSPGKLTRPCVHESLSGQFIFAAGMLGTGMLGGGMLGVGIIHAESSRFNKDCGHVAT